MTDDAASSGERAGTDSRSPPSGAVVREIPIINKRGLHARASAKFVKMVEDFDAEVLVTRGAYSNAIVCSHDKPSNLQPSVRRPEGMYHGVRWRPY